MRITRVINNNIVATKMNGKETILAGSGIGFRKKVGDVVEEERVEKRYHLYDNEFASYESLFKNTPILYFTLAEEILQSASDKLNFKISNASIFAMADHIYCAVCRAKEGIYAPNLVLQEIQILYSEEYEVGKAAVSLIEAHTKVALSNDEAGYIASHIVNARADDVSEKAENILIITEGILNILEEMYDFHPSGEDFYYKRFLIHLKFLAKRIVSNEKAEMKKLSSLYEQVSGQFDKYLPCLKRIEAFLQEMFDYTLDQDEALYILIHIIKILNL